MSKCNYLKCEDASDYKYTLQDCFRIQLPFLFPELRTSLGFTVGSMLTIKKGYAWDGATCAIDTDNFIDASLVHDFLYQMIREKVLGKEYRLIADKILKAICLANGMSSFRVGYVYTCVRLFGWRHV